MYMKIILENNNSKSESDLFLTITQYEDEDKFDWEVREGFWEESVEPIKAGTDLCHKTLVQFMYDLLTSELKWQLNETEIITVERLSD